jgi:flagella basal body P-ring formation protein FlgA
VHLQLAQLAIALALTPAIATATAGTWQEAADRALDHALRSAHPAVVQWSTEALIGKRQAAMLQSAGDFHASAVHLGKRSAVRLTWQGKRGEQSTLVWFGVSGMQSVITAASDLRMGTPLGADVARQAHSDVMAAACTPITSPDALTGKRTRRSIRAGEVICEAAIEPQPAVGRGQHVTVIATVGAVTVTAQGIAQQDAGLGERLRVKSPSSGLVYVASATGQGEVTVHE